MNQLEGARGKMLAKNLQPRKAANQFAGLAASSGLVKHASQAQG